MIDASHDFVKDCSKKRLRERDICKITTTFNQQITTNPKYARFVPKDEIKIKNEYNLDTPHCINSSISEDLQDIEAHLHGGISAAGVESIGNTGIVPQIESMLLMHSSVLGHRCLSFHQNNGNLLEPI